jgi:PAS domain S-box-containing protein
MRTDTTPRDSQTVPSLRDGVGSVVSPEERFRILVDAVEDYAIFMLDPRGCVASWNAGAQKIKGYAEHEIIGSHFSRFYPPDDVAAGKPDRELVIAAKAGRLEDEGWRVRKDGSMFWANVVISAIYDRNRQLRGFAKVTRDMTERKRLRELEAASNHMSEFLATLAHELRNPLAPVRNAINLMALEPLVSPTLKQCRDMLDRQISHLSRLVDDLLDVGRVTTGKVALRVAPIDLNEVVVRSVEMSLPHLDMRQQVIDVACPPSAVIVNGDMARLVQVVQNLLNNASKFSEPGARIGVAVQTEGIFATLRVSDAGCGIASEALESIFNLFVQGDNRLERNVSGLGVGLTLCRSLVELHGGAIAATSAGAGQGATFIVRLPRLVATPAELGAGSGGVSLGKAPVALCVLIIDDNRDSADSMAMLVGFKGHRVRVAYSGEQAVRIARAERIDVALVDIAMPGADGFTVLRQLKEIPALRDMLSAAMTGFGQESDVRRALDGGFDSHLTKPVHMPLVDAFLQRAIDKRGG